MTLAPRLRALITGIDPTPPGVVLRWTLARLVLWAWILRNGRGPHGQDLR